MDMEITFPGGSRVDASFGSYVVKTDQPSPDGSPGSAPTPFATFLASIGTCAGIYVLGFLRQRGLPTENVRLVQRLEANPFTGMVQHIQLDVHLPPEVPQKYHSAIVRAAELCAVKKHFVQPPEISVSAREIVPA